MTTMSQPLFAWPANPSLTALHLVARVALALTNIVGLSVSYAAGATTDKASFWIAASFMTTSLIFFQPMLILWNKTQLRRSKMVSFNNGPVAQGSSPAMASSPARVGTKFLWFATFTETIAVLAYWIVWGVTIHDSVSGSWYYSTDGFVALMTYSGAATLTCALIHTFLCGTQMLQLWNAYPAKPSSTMVCPHCHHSLDEVTGGNSSNRGRGSSPPMTILQAEESQNLLGRDSFNDAESDRQTVIDVAPVPGQETGTCAVTPRVSTSSGALHASSASGANESGTAESDRLMEKIACDLHATTGSGWFSRVMPHMV